MIEPFFVIATVDQKWFYSCLSTVESSAPGDPEVTTVLQDGYDEEVPTWYDGEKAHSALDDVRKTTTKYEQVRGPEDTFVVLDEPPDLIVLKVDIKYVYTPFAANPVHTT